MTEQQTEQQFCSAQLALAAYASLLPGEVNDQKTSLERADFTNAQATEFATRYPKVVATFDDSITGLQVTVFKDTSNNLTVAFRGSTFPEDLPTGVDIVGAGAGYNQIVAMANWWAKASAPSGMVQQFRLISYATDAVPAGAVVLRSDGVQSFVLEAAPTVEATRAKMGKWGQVLQPNINDIKLSSCRDH